MQEEIVFIENEIEKVKEITGVEIVLIIVNSRTLDKIEEEVPGFKEYFDDIITEASIAMDDSLMLCPVGKMHEGV